MFTCQKQCFTSPDQFVNKDNGAFNLNGVEKKCLRKCIDQQSFFDSSVFEMDAANEIALEQGKQKRAYIYQKKRLVDLATPVDFG